MGFPRIHLVLQPEFLLEAASISTGDCSTAELPRNGCLLFSFLCLKKDFFIIAKFWYKAKWMSKKMLHFIYVYQGSSDRWGEKRDV